MSRDRIPSRSDNMETNIALVAKDVAYLKDTMDKIDSRLNLNYATKDELQQVKNAVAEAKKESSTVKKMLYGLGWLIVSSVLLAGMNIIIRPQL